MAAVSADVGDKMRVGQEDITEGYILCQQEGVETVTIEEEGLTVTINCDEVPSFPEAGG